MAHPQSNFTSTFNGTPLGNAKLTLSVNGVDHEYTPSGNDQTVDINGNEVVHIDDPDFVQLLNVADADKCELIIKQDITADGAYRKYRLTDCYVLNGDREWRFTCTAGNIEYILTVTEDGSVTPSQRLIPGASNSLPLEDGIASAGTSNEYSREDHVHPHDSTKEDVSNKTSYIDPTTNQAGKYLGGSAVNGFVEKRTFAISVPHNVSNNNTFTKILEYNEIYSSSTSRGALFTRLKIQFVDTYLEHRLPEVDAYIGYDLYNKKTFVTFGNCYKTVYESDYDFKNLHIVTYGDSSRCHIEVYLEHKKLTSMRQWISVEVCENFQITESSYRTYSDHSNWKIPLTNYSWDDVNGASIQPTAAALPTTGVLKTDSYIIQSGNQVPFTYMPFGSGGHEMAIAKLVGNSSYTKLVFKLYCKREGWAAIGKVERVNDEFKLSFSAIADNADFEAGVAVPYIYLSLLDGVYFVNLKIDSYHTVLESIAIEVENVKKDWEFFGSIPPAGVGTTVSGTDTYMKADLTAEVIDQGTNVPAPTSSTKVLTKQVDANGREFWKTEQLSDIAISKLSGTRLGNNSQDDLDSCVSGSVSDRLHSYYWVYSQKDNVSHKPTDDSGQCLSVSYDVNNAIQIVITGSGVTYSRSNVVGTWTNWFNIRDASWINSGTFDAARIPTASSVTSGDTTHVPTSAAVYDYVINCGTASLTSFSYKYAKLALVQTPSTLSGEYNEYSEYFEVTASNAPSGTVGFVGILCVQARVFGSTYQSSNARLFVLGTNPNGFVPKLHVYYINATQFVVYAEYIDTEFSINVKLKSQISRGGDLVAENVTYYHAVLESSVSQYSTETTITTDRTIHSSNLYGVGSPTCPVYANSDGSLAACNLRLVSATSDVSLDLLGNGEDAWIRVRNAGNSSITVTAGTLNRTLSPTQTCDVYGYQGAYVQIS